MSYMNHDLPLDLLEERNRLAKESENGVRKIISDAVKTVTLVSTSKDTGVKNSAGMRPVALRFSKQLGRN